MRLRSASTSIESPGAVSGTGPSFTASLYRVVEHALDKPFGARANPLKQLGAIGFLLLWLLVASGVPLYIMFDTAAEGAYRSIESLDLLPWRLGSILRGLHRYATDAFVCVMGLHILREWMLGRFRHFRKWLWITGVPLVVLAFISAVGGFWLNWDRLGQYSAQTTAEWIDALPLLAMPLARNFLYPASLGDRLFTLFIFIHIGASLFLIFGLWFHIQRISRARVLPEWSLAACLSCTLILLCLVLPVHGQGPADLQIAPAALALDWWILFIHPLTVATSPAIAWGLVLCTLGLLLLLPFLPTRLRSPVAVVNPDNCSGCARCFDDCPYSAITMVPHPDRLDGLHLARVDAAACASCGICTGACPSSTPFRHDTILETGIDMPQAPIDSLRRQLRQGLEEMQDSRRLVVFSCNKGATLLSPATDILHFELICAGMLPPAFVEFAIRAGADGVLVSGCREGGCVFRLGQQWMAGRLVGMREPHLRSSVAQDRWLSVWADPGDEATLQDAIDVLRRRCDARIPVIAKEMMQ
ncbi:MAG: hydrogenase iron-sulfur subunit [Proteobacteria bacterium]|nr:hydrogenase iron-sulfur subunit [Pseudomonadota bacterium]HQR02732.1 hydrogenase iron-sulfur subunit [Rhodocyclaceae bacterium]